MPVSLGWYGGPWRRGRRRDGLAHALRHLFVAIGWQDTNDGHHALHRAGPALRHPMRLGLGDLFVHDHHHVLRKTGHPLLAPAVRSTVSTVTLPGLADHGGNRTLLGRHAHATAECGSVLLGERAPAHH